MYSMLLFSRRTNGSGRAVIWPSSSGAQGSPDGLCGVVQTVSCRLQFSASALR